MPKASIRWVVEVPVKLDEMLTLAAKTRGKFKTRLVKEIVSDWLIRSGSVVRPKPIQERSAYVDLFETPEGELK